MLREGHICLLALPALWSGAMLWGRGDREGTRDCDAIAALDAWSVGPGEATRVAGTGVRGVELGDVGLETFAGPTSVLKAAAIASSAAASVASQSPGWANTSKSFRSFFWLPRARTLPRCTQLGLDESNFAVR